MWRTPRPANFSFVWKNRWSAGSFRHIDCAAPSILPCGSGNCLSFDDMVGIVDNAVQNRSSSIARNSPPVVVVRLPPSPGLPAAGRHMATVHRRLPSHRVISLRLDGKPVIFTGHQGALSNLVQCRAGGTAISVRYFGWPRPLCQRMCCSAFAGAEVTAGRAPATAVPATLSGRTSRSQ